jgi:hypothetical protein
MAQMTKAKIKEKPLWHSPSHVTQGNTCVRYKKKKPKLVIVAKWFTVRFFGFVNHVTNTTQQLIKNGAF